MVEATEGGPGMFLRVTDFDHITSDLSYYTLRQDNGGSSGKWHEEKTLVSLGSEFRIIGSTGSCLFLVPSYTSPVKKGYFTLNVKTLQHNFVNCVQVLRRTRRRQCVNKERRHCKLESPLIAQRNSSSADDADWCVVDWRWLLIQVVLHLRCFWLLFAL